MFGNMFESLRISGSAISAERKRMNVIANNLANMNTTRGPNNEPYRRKYVVFETIMDKANNDSDISEKGVKVSAIKSDSRPFRKKYDPGHPDADERGYVSYPNIDMVEENVDLLSASRAYGMNLNVLRESKAMVKKMIELMTA